MVVVVEKLNGSESETIYLDDENSINNLISGIVKNTLRNLLESAEDGYIRVKVINGVPKFEVSPLLKSGRECSGDIVLEISIFHHISNYIGRHEWIVDDDGLMSTSLDMPNPKKSDYERLRSLRKMLLELVTLTDRHLPN